VTALDVMNGTGENGESVSTDSIWSKLALILLTHVNHRDTHNMQLTKNERTVLSTFAEIARKVLGS